MATNGAESQAIRTNVGAEDTRNAKGWRILHILGGAYCTSVVVSILMRKMALLNITCKITPVVKFASAVKFPVTHAIPLTEITSLVTKLRQAEHGCNWSSETFYVSTESGINTVRKLYSVR